MHRRFIFLLTIVLGGCFSKSGGEQSQHNNNSQVKTNGKILDSLGVEIFDKFYEKFKSDSFYQVSRIVFPLPIETYDLDKDVFIRCSMAREEWSFMNFELKKQYKLKTAPATKDTMKINVQMEDTGVSVNYIFTLENNQWRLVEIVDEST